MAGPRSWSGDWAALEAEAPRVNCRVHGPTVVAVPWARHGAGHTYAFDDTVAWLAVHASKTAVAELMRVAWRPVGAICAWVSADARAKVDLLAGLRRMGMTSCPTSAGTGTSRSWSTTTPGAWCGPRRAGTRPPWPRSPTRWAPNGARSSRTCPPTARSVHRCGRRPLSKRGAWRRPLSRGGVGYRRIGPGPPRRV